MLLSIVIPAFNEARELPLCLASVMAAIAVMDDPEHIEIIVADNNSTDATALLARAAGVTVVFEPVNQIGRARNAGAAVARGSWILFIDADSRLEPWNLRRVIEIATASDRVIGGGCTIVLDPTPRWLCWLPQLWNGISVVGRLAAGSFLFCRTDVFREIGGFDTGFFAAEEVDLSLRLHSWAKSHRASFVILTGCPHVSSGRKFYLHPPRWLARQAYRALRSGRHLLRNRDHLDFFYDGRR